MEPAQGRRKLDLAIAAAAMLICALVMLAEAVPASAEPHVYLSSFGPDGTESSDFNRAASLAIDQGTGAVYVLDSRAFLLYKFDAEGLPLNFGGSSANVSGNTLTGLVLNTGLGESQIAVDSTSHVIYVTEEDGLRAYQEDGEPAEFTAGPGEGTSEIPGFGELLGVAVDAGGNIYASDAASGVLVFAPSGELITQFSATEPANIAVAPNGVVYVVSLSGVVTKFTPSESPVTPATTYVEASEPVNPGRTFTVAVDPNSGDVYLAQFSKAGIKFNSINVFDQNGAFVESIGQPEEPGELFDSSSGIGVNPSTQRVYVSTDDAINNVFSKVRIFGPKVCPKAKPSVSASSSGVTATSAILRAQINPQCFDTTYYFEYGTSECPGACSKIPLEPGLIAAGEEAVAVAQDLSGLLPGTTYHYRVVAKNEEGETPSIGTFITQTGSLSFQLGDARAWERVSPVDKHGGLIVRGLQAAADGNGVAFLSLGSIEADPEGNRAIEGATALASRGPAGWSTEDISSPNIRVGGIPSNNEYRLFSPDLSEALVEPHSETLLSTQASGHTPYLRENSDPPSYTPLVTAKEGFANVPPDTDFGSGNALPRMTIIGTSPDLEHVVLRSPVPLVSGAPKTGESLYYWSAGHVQAVNVLPDDEGGAMVPVVVLGSGSVQRAVSDNGSRVFWGSGGYGSIGNKLTALYMRDTDAEETVRLDKLNGGDGFGEARPAFQGASADGTVVFFKDSRHLTADSSLNGFDLYRCEIPAGQSAQGCATLTDVSAPLESSGESSMVRGMAPAVSDDGGHIYFVAEGVLDAAPNAAGEEAVPGEPNLYDWHEGEGVRFIATLSSEDDAAWGERKIYPYGITEKLSAAGSPNGRYLAFMSERSLTGYDNRDAVAGKPVQEIFRYDASADRLDCVSCKPTGASPEGEVLSGLQLIDPLGIWDGHRVAAVLPEAISDPHSTSIYRPRAMLDNGRVFFNSVDSLVPADSNGYPDVYQYEPTGEGDCNASSGGLAIARSAGGCVSLLSSGGAQGEASFLDASESGDDVFFISPARLSVLDEDDVNDVYDARVDGVPDQLTPIVECRGESCQPTTSAPNDPTPSSAAYNGPGNVRHPPKRCRPGYRRVRRNNAMKCVKKKHKAAKSQAKGGRR